VAVTAFALGTVWLPGVAAADWPIYGHDLANSRDAGAAGPSLTQVGWISQPAWTFKASTGDFTGTPVVANGVLVAGDNGGFVYALNAVTGKVLWSKDVGQQINATAAIDVGAPGGATVFVPVAQVGTPRVLALRLSNGATRWNRTLTVQPGADAFGSPVFWQGTVYIGTSGNNEDNSTARGSVVALNEGTGKVRWQTFTVPRGSDGAGVWSTPAIDTSTGRLYAGTGNNYHNPTTDTEDAIISLDAASGALLGKFQATSNDSFSLPSNPAGPDFDFGASPNLITGAGGEQLVGEGQKSGTYWALDRATMQPVWQFSAGPGGPLGGILGSTAYDGQRIFGTDTLSGQVFGLTAAGALAWQSADAGGLHVSPATIANGVLYTVDPSGALVARDPGSGTILGRFSLGQASFGGVSAVGHALYVAVGTGPPPGPAPQQDGSGSIIAFGDTSQSGATTR